MKIYVQLISVELESIRRRIQLAENEADAMELYHELVQHLLERRQIEDFFKTLVDKTFENENISGRELLTRPTPQRIVAPNCYYAALDEFNESCFKMGKYPYSMR